LSVEAEAAVAAQQLPRLLPGPTGARGALAVAEAAVVVAG